VIVWKLYLVEATGLYELVPGFFLACIALVIVSLLTHK
jgi:hypothetical protein